MRRRAASHLAAQKPPGPVAVSFEQNIRILRIATMFVNQSQPLVSRVLPQQL